MNCSNIPKPATGMTEHNGRLQGRILGRALAWFARHCVLVQLMITDSGSAYRSKLFADVLRGVGARHVRPPLRFWKRLDNLLDSDINGSNL